MNEQYKQLSLKERLEIEKGLDRGDSFREIARLIERQPSTISREVKENRQIKSGKAKKALCREREWCSRKSVCAQCVRAGSVCATCDAKDCRDECGVYAAQGICERMTKAPWVCNGCRKYRYGCHRQNRQVYDAKAAQRASDERRSESRVGIDMPPEKAQMALECIKEGISRGLSPYEISVLYADRTHVHPSTIYRWIEKGYGELTNLELERKVGFKPRKKSGKRKSTSHSKKRSYEAFEQLCEESRISRSELDCVIGRACDTQCVLTLYNLPTHMQLALLLDAHTCSNVKDELKNLKERVSPEVYDAWTLTVLTDNGEEFSDEDELGALFGESVQDGELKVHLYYCDPRQSQQKGGCEKNHTEIRQLLEKGSFIFDELTRADMAVVMSHVNSNPRASLGGKSPIQMLRFVHGDNLAKSFMEALGIREICRDELMLQAQYSRYRKAKKR